jgi:uroporphyrin-III C-methyltransferase
MNESSPTSTPPPAAAPRRFQVNWGAALGVVAIVLVTLVWLSGRDQSRGVKTDLARKLADADTVIKESKLLARNADDLARQNSNRLAQVEAHLANSREQQLALESLYKELARDRDQWALSDVEQILLTASQQLQLGGNIKAAIIGLEAADQRLLRLGKPQFARLRQAIGNDLGKLRATPMIDREGVSYSLNALSDGVGQWPLSSAHTRAPAKDAKEKTHFGQSLLAEFKNLIQIRRLEQNEPALLVPEQEYFLRQNLKLRLLSARLSLLSHDRSGYVADLRAAEKLLTRYFNTSDPGVSAALAALRKLGAINISPVMPELSASLAALQAFHQARQ